MDEVTETTNSPEGATSEKTDPSEALARAVRSIRNWLHMDQASFGRLCGSNAHGVNNWEKGKSEPCLDALEILGTIARSQSDRLPILAALAIREKDWKQPFGPLPQRPPSRTEILELKRRLSEGFFDAVYAVSRIEELLEQWLELETYLADRREAARG